MLGDEQRIINKHLLEKVLKFCHIGEIKADQVEMFDAKVTLAYIMDTLKEKPHFLTCLR